MQHAQYRVDVKMLIDATGSMGGLIRKVQNAALKFHPDLMAALDAKGKVIDELRVGVTAFRDLNYDGKDSMIDSGFFGLPAQQDAFAASSRGSSRPAAVTSRRAASRRSISRSPRTGRRRGRSAATSSSSGPTPRHTRSASTAVIRTAVSASRNRSTSSPIDGMRTGA